VFLSVPFSPPLSFLCTFSPRLPSNTCFPLLVSTSRSRHYFPFFALSLPKYSRISCHTPLILPVVSGFFDYFPSFLLFCIFIPSTQLHSCIFLLIVIFSLLHWHTRFSDISLSPSSPYFFFFSLHHSVSILHSPVLSILSSYFAALFPAFTLSLFLFPHHVTWRFSVHS
jgi:hypothetical protein